MAEDEHGIDLAEDTVLYTADSATADDESDSEPSEEELEGLHREEKRQRDQEELERHSDAVEQSNPNNHRDDEPYD